MENEHEDQNLKNLLRAMAVGRTIAKTSQGFRLFGRGAQTPGPAVDPRWISAGLRLGFIAPVGTSTFALTASGRKQAQGDTGESERKKVLETRLIGVDKGEPLYATVNVAESPLSWLRSHAGGRALSAEEFAAGELLRDDFTRARMTATMTANWERPVSGGQRGVNRVEEAADQAIAARKRFAAALASVGPGLSDVLVSVCCELRGLEECERRLQWPRRSAKLVLRIALERLARHYGLIVDKARAS